MRGVAPFFNAVIEYIELDIAGSHAIDEQEYAPCFEDPRYFRHELRHVGEMMCRDATGDALELGIREG